MKNGEIASCPKCPVAQTFEITHEILTTSSFLDFQESPILHLKGGLQGIGRENWIDERSQDGRLGEGDDCILAPHHLAWR